MIVTACCKHRPGMHRRVGEWHGCRSGMRVRDWSPPSARPCNPTCRGAFWSGGHLQSDVSCAFKLPNLLESSRPVNDVTRIISAIELGDPLAAEQLLPLVYDELRKLAVQKLAKEKSGQTLQPTALVHEAFLRLVDNNESQLWNSRGHFFGAAAEAMRRILVEQARRKLTDKHGGGRLRVDLPDDLVAPEAGVDDLIALDEALYKLERFDADAAQLVKLRYFAGLTHQDAADAIGISRGAADRLWALGRTWLFRQLSK
jgi:RNA polymerase sigma factor (TIGR02999 family)